MTGLSLAPAASGTIGLFGGAGDVDLPDDFNPVPYGSVDLAESLEISYVPNTPVAVFPAIEVDKTASPFLATFTNGGAAASGDLEIYVRYHN